MASKVRFSIVSRSPAVRAGLEALLKAEERLQLVRAAAGWAGIEAGDLTADVVVVDLSAPEDIDDLVEQAESDLELRPVVLGPTVEDARLALAFADRPWGYLARNASADEIASAAQAVAAGLVVMRVGLSVTSSPALQEEKTSDGLLSGRELEVLQLIAVGLPNKTIAIRLGISEHTAKFHVAAVLSKLGAVSRAEAVSLGIRKGLLAV